MVQWIIETYQEFIEIENRTVVTKGWGEITQRAQTFSYKMNNLGDLMYYVVFIVSLTIILYYEL